MNRKYTVGRERREKKSVCATFKGISALHCGGALVAGWLAAVRLSSSSSEEICNHCCSRSEVFYRRRQAFTKYSRRMSMVVQSCDGGRSDSTGSLYKWPHQIFSRSYEPIAKKSWWISVSKESSSVQTISCWTLTRLPRYHLRPPPQQQHLVDKHKELRGELLSNFTLSLPYAESVYSSGKAEWIGVRRRVEG